MSSRIPCDTKKETREMMLGIYRQSFFFSIHAPHSTHKTFIATGAAAYSKTAALHFGFLRFTPLGFTAGFHAVNTYSQSIFCMKIIILEEFLCSKNDSNDVVTGSLQSIRI